jgi:hypothetical protein
MPARKTKKPSTETKAKTPVGKPQDFNRAEARQDALAMFSSDLNQYERGADNKWRKTGKKP